MLQDQEIQRILFFVLLLWELIWKLLSMWKAGKRDSKVMFVLIFIFNTAGLLPILYLLYIKFEDPITRALKKNLGFLRKTIKNIKKS